MKMKPVMILLIMTIVLLVSSCTTFKSSGLHIAKNMPSHEVVGTFDATVKVWEFFGASGGANLFNITADKMDSKIYEAIQLEIDKLSGDAAVDVEIEYLATFGNLLLNGITYGITAPAQAKITGTIVKYNK